MQLAHRLVSIAVAIGLWFGGGARAGDLDCVIQPRQILEIRSPLEGLLERVTVDRGDMVRKGQELAFIETSVEQMLAESAKFRSQMQGAVLTGQSKLQLSARKLERAQELLRQQYIAPQAQEEALNEKQLAEAELQESRDNRKLAEIEHRRLLALMRLKTIRSPINGVVMERVLNVGELAEAGVGRKPILRLADIETLYVEALLPAAVYRNIKVGMVGMVSPSIPDAGVERATVKVIDRVLDAGSGTFGVRLEMPNKDGRLLAGLRCRINFAGVDTDTPAPRAAEKPTTPGAKVDKRASP